MKKILLKDRSGTPISPIVDLDGVINLDGTKLSGTIQNFAAQLSSQTIALNSLKNTVNTELAKRASLSGNNIFTGTNTFNSTLKVNFSNLLDSSGSGSLRAELSALNTRLESRVCIASTTTKLNASTLASLSSSYNMIRVTGFGRIIPVTTSLKGWLYENKDGWRIADVSGFKILSSSTFSSLINYMNSNSVSLAQSGAGCSVTVNEDDSIYDYVDYIVELGSKYSLIQVQDTGKIIPGTDYPLGWLYEYQEGWRVADISDFDGETFGEMLTYMDSHSISIEDKLNDLTARVDDAEKITNHFKLQGSGVPRTLADVEFGDTVEFYQWPEEDVVKLSVITYVRNATGWAITAAKTAVENLMNNGVPFTITIVSVDTTSDQFKEACKLGYKVNRGKDYSLESDINIHAPNLQETLVAGEGITIRDNVISATGGGGGGGSSYESLHEITTEGGDKELIADGYLNVGLGLTVGGEDFSELVGRVARVESLLDGVEDLLEEIISGT